MVKYNFRSSTIKDVTIDFVTFRLSTTNYFILCIRFLILMKLILLIWWDNNFTLIILFLSFYFRGSEFIISLKSKYQLCRFNSGWCKIYENSNWWVKYYEINSWWCKILTFQSSMGVKCIFSVKWNITKSKYIIYTLFIHFI